MRWHVAIAGTVQSNFQSASNETEFAEIARQRFASSVEQLWDNLRAAAKVLEGLLAAPVKNFITGDFKKSPQHRARDRNSNYASPQTLPLTGRAKAMARLFQRAKDPPGTIGMEARKVLSRTR